jgi:hypothetical protein
VDTKRRRPGLRRNEIAASPTPRTGKKKPEKWCNSGALFSLCIIFASLLLSHACLALYVEQVNERKLACVCGAWKSSFEAS